MAYTFEECWQAECIAEDRREECARARRYAVSPLFYDPDEDEDEDDYDEDDDEGEGY